MYDSPVNLRELCIDAICDNFDDIFEPFYTDIDDTGLSQPSDGSDMDIDSTPTCVPLQTSLKNNYFKTKYRCKQKDLFLYAELSENLFTRLSEKCLLNDQTITLFNSENTRLRHVKMKDIDERLTYKGLRQLYDHKIVELECVNIKVSVNNIIRCLGEWTLNNLRYLNVSKCTFVDNSKYCVVVPISKLKNLQVVNVSHTEFNKHGLEIACEDLKNLEKINISCTRVDDITPLKKCKDRLTSLTMFNIVFNFNSSMIPVLLELNNLTYLDISCERAGVNPFEVYAPRCKMGDLLKNVNALPNLTFLDISGKQELNSTDVTEFVIHHKSLTFLGLMFCECCQDDIFVNSEHPHYRSNLTVSGMASEKQILVSLSMYSERAVYVQKSLYFLFRLTPTLNEPRSDIIELVIQGMAKHPDQFGVQMAATACLYNLTKGELSLKIHPNILKKVVNLSLDAMQGYPNQNQLQKNALLTLCSDRILQDVNFDKFRCAKLVISALCSTDDPSMNRMAVAIISILAAKITTEETSVIGAVPMYMKKLLSMIRTKVNERNCDITMKFTLSALWNLTDESAITCSVFLKEGGIELFLEVLMTFAGESSIETKVLGLINNIAEVPALRSKLLIPEFILKLKELLNSSHIDVSYFAAGIIAHLASDGKDCWAIQEIPRAEMLTCLGDIVSNWKTPEGEMVAYRSFRPFFPLLKCSVDYQIQLWAVWAIHHVCTKNPKRYCQMLLEEGGNVLLEQIIVNNATHNNIKTISLYILETLNSESANVS